MLDSYIDAKIHQDKYPKLEGVLTQDWRFILEMLNRGFMLLLSMLTNSVGEHIAEVREQFFFL